MTIDELMQQNADSDLISGVDDHDKTIMLGFPKHKHVVILTAESARIVIEALETALAELATLAKLGPSEAAPERKAS